MEKELKELTKEIDDLENAEHNLELIPRYKNIIEKAKNVFGDNHTETLRLYNNFGGLLRNLGFYEASEQVLRQAVLCAQSIRGTRHPDYATTLGNLANLLRVKKDFSESEALFQEALLIYKNTIGEYHFLNSGIYNNLGLLYQEKGQLAQAKQCFQKGIFILKKDDKYKIPYAIALHNTVELHKLLGNTELAEQILKEELSIYKELHYEGSVLYASALHSLGLLYYDKGKTDKAIELLTKSMNISLLRLGKNSESYLTCKKNLEMIQMKRL